MARQSSSRPTVSVIVPTFRRPDGLERLLRALPAQEDPGVSWEVIVIDNDDPPSAEQSFARSASELGDRARLVSELRKGPSYARNRGIAEAKGDIVAMVDDDVTPEPEWLANLLAPILAGRCDGVCGSVVLDPLVARPTWLDDDEIGSYLAAHHPADVEREVRPGEYIVSSNAAFKTDLLRACGGFDPAFGPQRGLWLVNEDVLLGRRFMDAGGRLRHVPAAVVVHELPPTRLRPRYLLRRAYVQGRSDWLLVRDKLVSRPTCGMGGAVGVLAKALVKRVRSGITRRPVAFHAACNVAWATGAVRQSAAFLRERSMGEVTSAAEGR